ncbi:hypothetical protein PROFUN_10875 [Planoprotostelium fungivorum]|uniref:SAP domain-containing protein n=1 Tax=Planoprotostelium fungivorum TaxID=1890364 RepID=A0A2P6NC52_9EUKA|nr:hypothetical protein PROFUN_10875 [Planoprotostelium fungivorum]
MSVLYLQLYGDFHTRVWADCNTQSREKCQETGGAWVYQQQLSLVFLTTASSSVMQFNTTFDHDNEAHRCELHYLLSVIYPYMFKNVDRRPKTLTSTTTIINRNNANNLTKKIDLTTKSTVKRKPTLEMTSEATKRMKANQINSQGVQAFVKSDPCNSGNESSAASSPVGAPLSSVTSPIDQSSPLHLSDTSTPPPPSTISITSAAKLNSMASKSITSVTAGKSVPPKGSTKPPKEVKVKPPPPLLMFKGVNFAYLCNLKVNELQEHLRKHKASVKGNKPQLLERLAKIQYDLLVAQAARTGNGDVSTLPTPRATVIPPPTSPAPPIKRSIVSGGVSIKSSAGGQPAPRPPPTPTSQQQQANLRPPPAVQGKPDAVKTRYVITSGSVTPIVKQPAVKSVKASGPPTEPFVRTNGGGSIVRQGTNVPLSNTLPLTKPRTAPLPTKTSTVDPRIQKPTIPPRIAPSGGVAPPSHALQKKMTAEKTKGTAGVVPRPPIRAPVKVTKILPRTISHESNPPRETVTPLIETSILSTSDASINLLEFETFAPTLELLDPPIDITGEMDLSSHLLINPLPTQKEYHFMRWAWKPKPSGWGSKDSASLLKGPHEGKERWKSILTPRIYFSELGAKRPAQTETMAGCADT